MSYADEPEGYPAPGQYGYGKDGPLGANLAMCPQQIAERFDCLAMTLEIPFKAPPYKIKHACIYTQPESSAATLTLTLFQA